ncbi:16S rRNA (cytidine(1402)-2'-O)-methyltransferase [Miniphocaeibacter halophilus]|uniref:16S rRNA (Cytidine(1402)-2'-O)-methyltransferase n=1 Tax=Miniphocaeibacter halophilus TaxID=2931922 RepID=A0AC61MRW8_9FIRM|nr:16S rRNA (cytidine(1402)-2'-O)-methyltransferase [Miniphocaeibacter halophilus]QQK07335.1 16S rRNA (cytidine(1402)-2'-O)-methyltransferase [Miniphocaeibacter halophilus]
MENKLYIVPTPIGNLKDITLRALDVLKEVDVIYCEDTRNTVKLLNHYDIKNNLKSYHEHNEKLRTEEIARQIQSGLSIAIVSDAGMPGISDPGHTIIKYFIENNMEFEVLPGATASITALVSSGLDNDKFAFLGFVPREKKKLKEFYELLDNLQMTSIIYESVHRIKSTLKKLAEVYPNRKVVVCRELTKIYEEKISGTCNELYNIYKNKNNIKGEFVIVLDKAEVKEELLDIKKLLLEEINNGLSKKESVKAVTSKYGLNKNEVYKISLEL